MLLSALTYALLSTPLITPHTQQSHITSHRYNFPHDLDLNLNNIDCCVKSVKGEGGSGGKSKNKRPSLLSLRQWSPLAVAQQVQIYIKDRKTVFDRRDRQDGFEMTRDYVSNKYPEYYLQNFHYQTDGWLSAKSARLYDYQVESLFLGTGMCISISARSLILILILILIFVSRILFLYIVHVCADVD